MGKIYTQNINEVRKTDEINKSNTQQYHRVDQTQQCQLSWQQSQNFEEDQHPNNIQQTEKHSNDQDQLKFSIDTLSKKKKIRLTSQQEKKKQKILVGEGQQTKNIIVSFCSALYDTVLDNLKKKEKSIFKQNYEQIKQCTTSNTAASISHFNQMIGLIETNTVRQNPEFFKENLPNTLKNIVSSGQYYRRLMKGSSKKKIYTKLIILKRFDKIVNCLMKGQMLTEWK